jgi:predicted AAA+ superfamily ATPase
MNNILYTRLLTPPKSSFFLFGPRGVGKSTWLSEHFPKAKKINLLDETLYQSYLANTGLFYQELNNIKPGAWVAVDEIQRLPQLLNEVHRLIEENKLKFLLTGSSARKLKRSGVNLLAGRAVRRNMYPLTPFEMGIDFKLQSALHIGTLPLVLASEDPADTLASYVQMYLKEEIQAEALVKNLSGFSRFLPIAALFHGQILNISNVARDAEVRRPTVQGFFEILEDTLLAYRLEAFESNLRVRERKAAKFYWIDPGIVRAAQKKFGPPVQEELGPLFEGLVYMLLRFKSDTLCSYDKINYWAPAESKKTEVDFLISRGKEFFAVEVKATTRLRPEHFMGLNAISELKGLKKKILVYMGTQDLKTNNQIEVMSFGSFIKWLEKN